MARPDGVRRWPGHYDRGVLRIARSILTLTALAVALSACTGSAASPDAGSSVEARVAEIRAARAAVGDVAAALGEAANETQTQVGEIRLAAISDPRARREAVDAVRSRALADLRAAEQRAGRISLGGDTADVQAARRAWDHAREAARRLEAAADDDLTLAAELASAEVALDDVVAGWDAPGSYSQQLARFAELTDQARTVLTGMRAAPPPPCSAYLQRRMDAAHAVIAASVELHGLVERRAGNEFDARREELAPDPFGLGALLSDLDARDASCWQERGRTPLAAAEVRASLRDLVAALNPPLDASPGPTVGATGT